MFQSVGNGYFVPVTAFQAVQPEAGAMAAAFSDSIVSVKNTTSGMRIHELPPRCLVKFIEYSGQPECSVFNGLKDPFYQPDNNKWGCVEYCESSFGVSAVVQYKKTSINIHVGDTGLVSTCVSPPIAMKKECSTLKDVYDAVEEREYSL